VPMIENIMMLATSTLRCDEGAAAVPSFSRLSASDEQTQLTLTPVS